MWGSASAGIDISLITPEMVFASIKFKPFCAFINIFITLEMGNFKATIWQPAIFLCYACVLWEIKFILVRSIPVFIALQHAIYGPINWESICPYSFESCLISHSSQIITNNTECQILDYAFKQEPNWPITVSDIWSIYGILTEFWLEYANL